MASQITSLMIVYSTVFSRRRSKKTEKLRVTGSLCVGGGGGGIHQWPVKSPQKKASNAENVSIGWRHDVFDLARNIGIWNPKSFMVFIHGNTISFHNAIPPSIVITNFGCWNYRITLKNVIGDTAYSQILQQSDNSNPKSRGFVILCDLNINDL